MEDLSPRGGASYHLFGNGRTALKMSLGRYVAKTGTQIPTANNPIQTSVNTVARTLANGVSQNFDFNAWPARLLLRFNAQLEL